MKDEVLRQMDEFGCAPALRAMVERLPDELAIVVKTGVGDFLPLAAADDCVAGVYMDHEHLHLLLTPADARAAAAATGCRIVKTNQETAYLKVVAAEAADDRIAPRLQDAFNTAVRRSGTRYGPGGEGNPPGGGQRPQRTCPQTFELVPANGICEVHGAVCS